MKRIIFGFVACIIMLTAVPAFAGSGQVTYDLKDLAGMDSQKRTIILNSIQKDIQTKEKAVKEKAKTAIVDNVVNMDTETLKAFSTKASSIADIIITFCNKLGVTVNDFLKTPAGNFIIFGVLYKMGVFGSVWWFFKGGIFLIIFGWLLWALNTKKKVKLTDTETDANGNVTNTSVTEQLIPRFTSIHGDDDGEKTGFSIIASIIVFVVGLFLIW